MSVDPRIPYIMLLYAIRWGIIFRMSSGFRSVRGFTVSRSDVAVRLLPYAGSADGGTDGAERSADRREDDNDKAESHVDEMGGLPDDREGSQDKAEDS